jgi:16S rRNA (cytidine1402-2'-O)-methyltransferase
MMMCADPTRKELARTGRDTDMAGRETAKTRREPAEAGVLTLAAAPIGRAEDASARLVTELAEATLIAAEDTRRVRWLAASLNVELKARVVSYYDAVETRRTPGLLEDLKAGQDILLITDAGTPAISDPGYRLVAAAAEAGLRVTALPGPSAVTTALAVSGLPTDRFCFEGFPPRGKGQRNTRFAELAADSRTQVYFEAGRRLASTLAELTGSHGEDRRAVVCRELTKTHEEIVRGTLAELATWAAAAGGGSGAVRGEITLVVAGTGRRRARDAGDPDGPRAGPGAADGPGARRRRRRDGSAPAPPAG